VALRPAERFTVEDPSQVAPARRAAERLAQSVGFDATDIGRAAIVTTELAANLLRHAGGGEIVLRVDKDRLDVLAWDRGPGIDDLAKSMRDGFSTAGGSGTGLGAVQRLADGFDVHSVPGRGAIVLARLGPGGDATPLVDGLALALGGDEASGDAWASVTEGAATTVLLVDGLGHGLEASRAAAAAIAELRAGIAPEALLDRMHGAMRATRGAAAAIARIEPGGRLRFAGVGNISAAIVHGTTAKSLASMNGTLGHRVTRIQGYEHELPAGAALVMHSDGCQTSWDLSAYPGILRRDPLVVASVLIRDFERGRDDVSAVIARAPDEIDAA